MHYPQTSLVQQRQVSHTICAREGNEHSTEVIDYILSIMMNGHIWHFLVLQSVGDAATTKSS